MEVYLLKSSACLLLFFLFYKLFLERENMHYIKRFYLIASLVLSLIIPLITLTQYVDAMPASSGDMAIITGEVPGENIARPINYQTQFLWSIYILGVLIFGIKFFFSLNDILKKITSNTKEKHYSFIHVLLRETIIPHTFFNFIFLNKHLYKDNKIPREVLLHEQAHASQKHSADILFIEVLKVVFWFNPLLHLYKKEIKLNHEFLADQAVLKKGLDAYTYKELLLSFSSNQNNPSLANAINYSSIKKRFTVMKKQTSKRTLWLKGLIIFPLIGLIFYSFSHKKVVERELQNKTVQTSAPEHLDLYINNDNQILLNGRFTPIENLTSHLESYSPKSDLKGHGEQSVATIHIASKVAPGIITDLKDILYLKGWQNISISSWNSAFDEKEPSPDTISEGSALQEGATKKQIAEYNKLAKHYNKMIAKGGHMTFRLTEVKRLKYLYSIMTLDQRNNAEAFPDLPSPPPPPVEVETENVPVPVEPAAKEPVYRVVEGLEETTRLPPPPPPVPADATPAQKERYEKVIREYERKREAATLSPPPPPPSPLDHIKKMAEKGASFYLEGKPISSKKAIQVIKNNSSLNINSIRSTGGKPKVYITKDPIIIKN